MVWSKKIRLLNHERRLRFKARRRRVFYKGLQVLPNLFTLSNSFFGFCSIVFAAQSDFVGAAYFILLGALMDLLDGRVARMVGVTSELGGQLDSLSDAITFCLAPAFLMYAWELKIFGLLGFLACAFFLLSGILRLARFNITSEEQTIFFLGIPTTFAGCFLAILFLTVHDKEFYPIHLLLLFLLIISLAALMVSPLKFPSFKRMTRRWAMALCAATSAGVIIFGLVQVILGVFICYFLYGILHNCFTFARTVKKRKFNH